MKRILVALTGLLLAFSLAQPTIDGSIGDGEYSSSLAHSDSGAVVYWTIDGDTLYMGLNMESRGWVGIGLLEEKTNRKLGADHIIFTFDGDTAVVLDMFMDRARGEPVLDDDAGGSNSILDFAVSVDGSNWTVEFSRLLDTGQDTDVAITPGEPINLMLAKATTMALDREHTKRERWYLEDFVF